ncbi:MAG: peptidoglycan-associated lipoprotein Pal [Coxiellaceae bacterium]|nr:peptidoglycan-associated lipoprotein Pal [Coxiellaceae bacterium]
MKKLNWLTIIVFGFMLGMLSGCSYFKSRAKAPTQEGTQTAGLEDQGDFGDYNISAANRLKAPYNQSYHFEFNRYDVKLEDIESINVQANYLVGHPHAKVRIEGNADERGSREYNITLGWKRAKAVAEILKQQGANNAQVALVSYGKEKPIAFGHDEDSYSKNRRSDLIYEVK